MAVFYRNRRAHSETDPISETFDREFSNENQRSHSTSDLTSGRIDENSLFDVSPLPLDLSERVRGLEGTTEATGFQGLSTLQVPRVSATNLHEFVSDKRRVDNQPHDCMDQLSETGLSVSKTPSQGTHVRPKYNNLSDFLDEILEIESSGGEERRTDVEARDHIAMEVSNELNTTFDLPNVTYVHTASANSYTTTSPDVTPNVTWSNHPGVLYSSSKHLFDYHSHTHLDQHLKSAFSNANTSRPRQLEEGIPTRQYPEPSPEHCAIIQPRDSAENQSPSCSHQSRVHGHHSLNFHERLDPIVQRPQGLHPVQRIRREALEYAGHYLLRRRATGGCGESSKTKQDNHEPRQAEQRGALDTVIPHQRLRTGEHDDTSHSRNSSLENGE